ncbi:MAG TPA: MFS transporter [Gemmatimonadaceae bacterium]|nr:MFS transporter [Gemmatimonadaceae bacterium]
MAATVASSAPPASLEGIHRDRLFVASCCALAVSAVAFAVIGDILGALKSQFILDNQQVGYIGGAAIWGFAVSILLLGPLCDVLGMKFLIRCAMVCHVLGVIVMITATGFWTLFIGALVLSLGNGLIEAACNPLVVTLYPERKVHRLNQFHMWWPGGIVLGGLASFGLAQIGIISWKVRLGLILIPAVVYIVLMLREEFPATENQASGVSTGEMFKITLTSPLFLLLLATMFITASIELGPGRWIPAVLQSGGVPGILVLVWGSLLMAVLRRVASGPLIKALSPTGILLSSMIVSAIGLFLLSNAQTAVSAFIAGTVFFLGVCFVWPTMLGFASERVPRSGALGLALLGGAGMGVVGLVTSPWLGKVADETSHQRFVAEQPAVVSTLEAASAALTAKLPSVPTAAQKADVQKAIDATNKVVAAGKSGTLPPIETANAMRAVTGLGIADPAVASVQALLGPAENFGGRTSFRRLVPFAAVAAVIFALLWVNDRRKGGYRAQRIEDEVGVAPPRRETVGAH